MEANKVAVASLLLDYFITIGRSKICDLSEKVYIRFENQGIALYDSKHVDLGLCMGRQNLYHGH
jgi:hypothetical protein